MDRRTIWSLPLLFSALIITLVLPSLLTAQAECLAQRGAWEFDGENRGGIFVIAEGYSAVLFTDHHRQPFRGPTPTLEEKSRALVQGVGNVFAVDCMGLKSHLSLVYSTDPNLTEWELDEDIEVDGDMITWWVLEPDGSRPPQPNGTARRLKSEEGGLCEPMVGAWMIDEPDREGMFVQTESYGVEVIVRKGRTPLEGDPPSDAEGARGYDQVVNAGAWYQQCEPGNGARIRTLYNLNPNFNRTERAFSYSFENGLYSWWNHLVGDDPAGDPNGSARRASGGTDHRPKETP